jgi:alkanesulfonate monooxygenase
MNEPDFLWFCVLQNDGEYLGTKELPPRKPTLEYISSLIETAGEMGFSSLLTATNYHSTLENYTAAIAALARTKSAGLLIAVRPGMFDAAMYAKMISTAQNLFPGRVRVNIVTGSSPAENAMYGDFEPHEQRYERTKEFMMILRKLWTEEGALEYQSDRYHYAGTILEPKPAQPIPLYFGGASEPAMRIAAELADCYLLWGEPIEMLKTRIARIKELEQEFGRTLKIGLRTHVVVRETEDEAIAAANRMISKIDPKVRENFMKSYSKVDSTGQGNQIKILQSALEKGDLFIEANLWAGVGMARSGVGVAIVGNPEQVAAKIRDFQDIGTSTNADALVNWSCRSSKTRQSRVSENCLTLALHQPFKTRECLSPIFYKNEIPEPHVITKFPSLDVERRRPRPLGARLGSRRARDESIKINRCLKCLRHKKIKKAF